MYIKGVFIMRILRVDTNGEARVISLNDETVEDTLHFAICQEFGCVPSYPLIESGVWDEYDLSKETLIYLYAKDDVKGEPENEYCCRIISEFSIPSNILGPVILVKYIRVGYTDNYVPCSMEKEEIEHLLTKIGVDEVTNLYPSGSERN